MKIGQGFENSLNNHKILLLSYNSKRRIHLDEKWTTFFESNQGISEASYCFSIYKALCLLNGF